MAPIQHSGIRTNQPGAQQGTTRPTGDLPAKAIGARSARCEIASAGVYGALSLLVYLGSNREPRSVGALARKGRATCPGGSSAAVDWDRGRQTERYVGTTEGAVEVTRTG